MYLRNFILMGLIFFTSQLSAQIKSCITMEMDSLRRSNHPQIGALSSFEEWMTEQRKTYNVARRNEIIYRIPVVVHVVHNGEPVGQGANISQAQVQSQIEVLNEDFRRSQGSNGYNNHPAGVDTRIEFFLAAEDPEGNPLEEPGIDRVNGGRDEWPKGIIQNPIENILKPSTIWDPDRYFNIWTVNFGGFIGRNLLGYAQFPDQSGLNGLDPDEGSASTDGVVIGYKYFGSSEKGDFPELYAPFDLGRTTTHEVGHWLGLRHIWGDGDCFADDFCEDTPIASAPNYGCPVENISCGTADMFENYMDYTDDACMNIFTADQKERMRIVLENSPRRKEVVQEVITGFPEKSVNAEVRIYPNPASNTFRVEWDAPSIPIEIKMYSTSGRNFKIYHRKLEEKKIEVNVSNQEIMQGLYLFSMYWDNGSVTHRKIVLGKFRPN